VNLSSVKAKLRLVNKLGFVESMRKGNTGVGYTLEFLMGIEENNSSGADIEGCIEIKAKRKSGSSRVTSFCQSPIWHVKIRDIIKQYGLDAGPRINFYPSLKCGAPNPQGLTLKVDNDNLFIMGKGEETLAELPLEVLVFRFRQKYKQLILVYADREKQRGKLERFWFNEAYYCSKLSASKIATLLKQGKIVVEPRIWMCKETKKLRDRGMAIRLSDKWTKQLFLEVEKIM
tara:strand:- start:123 stop:815 length:693 start_codon:yes stop_codon:yes gene_type:complete